MAQPHVFAIVLAGGDTKRLSPLLGNYVTPVPAQMRRGPRWFAGSADAIFGQAPLKPLCAALLDS